MQKSEYQNIFNQEENHFYYLGMHDLIFHLLRLYLVKEKEDLKILDAGCGTGLLLTKLQKLGDAVGIDISDEAIKYTKKRGLKKVYRASVENIPFKDNSFDLITSVDVVYHTRVRSDLKAFREFYRILKPGGILVIKVPAFQWLYGKHDDLVGTKRRYRKEELEEKLVAAGFKIKKISYSYMFFLPFVFIKRWIDNRGRSTIHSDINSINPLVNKILILIQNLENKFLSFIDLPFGVSVVVVAQKAV